MHRLSILLLLLLYVLPSLAEEGLGVGLPVSAQHRLSSPDGRNEIVVSQKGDEFAYSISHDGKAMVTDSRLGLDLDNYTWERALARNYMQYDCWMNGFTIDSVSTANHRSTITNLWGEQVVVPDNYNTATLHLSKHDDKRYTVTIYNDDPTTNTKTKVNVKSVAIMAGRSISISLQPSGGAALYFVKR